MAEPVALDLVPRELIAPRIRKVLAAAVVFGVVIIVVAALFLPIIVAVVLGVVLAGPAVFVSIGTLRRRIELADGVISARHWSTRSVVVADAQEVGLQVRGGPFPQVAVRIDDGAAAVAVPVALYSGQGGRELPILGLRALADALAGSSRLSAVAVSSVLVAQLRAEARGAGLAERPLYRAARASGGGKARVYTLTEQQVAELTA